MQEQVNQKNENDDEDESIEENVETLEEESENNNPQVNDEEKKESDEDERKEVGKSASNAMPLSEEPKEITDNIISDIKLLYKDGTEFNDGDLINVDEDLRFELDWSLLNNHGYVAGDYFEFKLPKQLEVHNPLDGLLNDYGNYTVDTNGNVRFTFNERIEQESNVKGTFWFDTDLKESEITSTKETIELIINGKVVQGVVVNFKPTGGQAISKNGQPVGGNFNTEEAEWTVVVNTTRESLKNAIIDDPILEGQELLLDSIKLTEVEVDIEGEVTKDLDEVIGFTNNSTEENLNIELGDTNKAYKLTFKTKLLEKDFKEGTTNYKNDAFLKSDGKKDVEAGGSVSVSRPKSMEKTSSKFDKKERSIEWTVNANFTEQHLKENDVITDVFTFTVGDEEVTDIFEIKKDNISIKRVDQFDDKGKVTETSDAKDLFDITIVGNKVTYKLKKDSNKAFILKYKTELKEGAYINKDGKITNKIDLNGKKATTSQGVYQQVGKKTNSGINYKDKTIDWTITINADKQDLRNFILIDDFAGSGQKLVEDSIKIDPVDSGATITTNSDDEGFEVNFGNIKEQYTITYQTEFNYDFEGKKSPNFKNGVKITYDTSNGSDYKLEFGNEIKPNKETKSNGAKNGTVNQDTKEITWTVDINYNKLALADAEVKDAIPDNQSLVDGSVKIYETSIAIKGGITVGNDVTNEFKPDASENQVNVDFGEIDKSYRIEFKTKDKDGIYNGDEVYTNIAQFIPREDEVHNLTAKVFLPNQGEFIGKTGTHNKEDWTIDWKVDVNKSLSTTRDFTVTDDLGDPTAQILLEDTIKVTKAGSTDELIEGEGKDYKLTVNGNKFEIYFPGEITEAYEVTYSSYILAEETVDIDNDAEIQSNDVIKGTTEKTETVQVKISTGGGTGEGVTGGLALEKFEAESKQALEDVEFELIKTVGSKDIVVREGKTNSDGKLEWKGLKFGDYTLNEVIPDGYLGKASQTVTISSNESENVTSLLIENERKTGIVKIIKRDLGTSVRLSDAIFKLTNVETNQDYTLTTKYDGTIDQELPFGEYTIEEIEAPDGYRKMNPIDNVTIKVDEETEITIDNMKLIEIEGKKFWNDISSPIRPDNIKINLRRKTNGKLDDSFESRTLTVTPDNEDNWDYKFNEKFDKYNSEGIEFDYILEEDEVPSGYRSSFEIDEDGNYNVINTRTGSTNVAGKKTWVDDEEADRPASIKVNLLRGNTVIRTQEVTADEEGNWNYSFTGLSRYDSNGRYISYSVKEQAVPGYKTEIKGTTITNTRSEKTEIEITKGWLDEDESERPDSIDVRIYQNDDFFKEVTLTATDNWVYELQNIDAYDEDGRAYVYTLEEEVVPGYETIVDGYNITNRRTDKTSVAGEKIWLDAGPADRPESIEVMLTREVNGEKDHSFMKSQTVKPDGIFGKWIYQFDELDMFNTEGQAYQYKIDEVELTGYETTIDGFNITNRQVGKLGIRVDKIWENDTEEDRPNSILVDLIQNGEVIKTIELTKENGWAYQFEKLEQFDPEGLPYIYSVSEEKVEGYDTMIRAKEDGFEIINRFDNSSLPVEPEEDDEKPENGDSESGKPEEGDDATESEGPVDSEKEKREAEDDRLPRTGEANHRILNLIGMIFILVGLGIGKKKFEH